MKRIPQLDGWRGIAILLVVLDHLQELVWKGPHDWIVDGQHGVAAFFVLSGFLITGKLTESDVNLTDFYRRRAFRLMPTAWIFLALMGIIGLARGSDILECLFFVRNYFEARNVTAPFWSLSIEEQFYLVWPIVLLSLGITRAKWLALTCAVGAYTWCAFHRSFYEYGHGSHTEVHAYALLAGCFMALILRDERTKSVFNKWSRFAFWPCVMYLAWLSTQKTPVPSLLECGAWAVAIPHSAFRNTRWLSFPPLVWLGRISYSVYVWNTFAIPLWFVLPWMLRWIIPFAIPVASYYLIERPGIALGHRLVSRPVVPRRPTADGLILDSPDV